MPLQKQSMSKALLQQMATSYLDSYTNTKDIISFFWEKNLILTKISLIIELVFSKVEQI
jgi:hypothetical protein